MTAPLDDPLSYPGARPEQSFLLRGAKVEPLPGGFPFDGRHAVLAVGSNASPAQLTAKFRGQPCSDTLAGLIVSVSGLAIRPSAHLSRHGYWPFAPIFRPAERGDGVATVVLCLVDDDQLDVLDRTEPNYRRVRVDTQRHPVSGARGPGTVFAYASRHGVVDDDRLPTWSDPPPTQRALLAALLRCLPPMAGVSDPDELLAAVRARPELADDITHALQRHLRVRSGAPRPAGGGLSSATRGRAGR
jgi:hypothetical protein